MTIPFEMSQTKDFQRASGGDPGFPIEGGGNRRGGTLTYNFDKISKKLHEIEKIVTIGGRTPEFPLDLPLNMFHFAAQLCSNTQSLLHPVCACLLRRTIAHVLTDFDFLLAKIKQLLKKSTNIGKTAHNIMLIAIVLGEFTY